MSEVNLVTPQMAQGGAMKSAQGPELPVFRKSNVQDEPVKVAAVEDTGVRLSEGDREARVKEAAQFFAKDVFVVSDTKFTIFKDSSGQYITRFTNMRDGSVTYIPEPEVLNYMESMGRSRRAIVEIDA